MKLISVIVPVYNAEQYLNVCVESIRNQSYKNLEIILVDDGSTDGSGQLCDNLAMKDERIHVIHKKNGGVSSARNTGLDYAHGDLVAFCDADDYMTSHQIEKLYSLLMDAKAELSICGYSIFVDNPETELLNNNEYKSWDREEIVNNILNNDKCKGYLWNKLFDKKIIDAYPKITFYENIAIMEDEIFVLEYTKRINKACFTSEELYGYRQNLSGALHQGITSRMLTILLGWKEIYKILIDMNCTEQEILKVSVPLTETSCMYFRKIFKKDNIDKEYWVKEIVNILSEIPIKHMSMKNWKIHNKITFVLIKCAGKFIH